MMSIHKVLKQGFLSCRVSTSGSWGNDSGYFAFNQPSHHAASMRRGAATILKASKPVADAAGHLSNFRAWYGVESVSSIAFLAGGHS